MLYKIDILNSHCNYQCVSFVDFINKLS